mmetsp:Transcript_10570/g.22557  ORF Transcript_10570/g.22557 Transcript_10570/m.22557 type:complete len:99 (-) Transcript_10570:627-923(-)
MEQSGLEHLSSKRRKQLGKICQHVLSPAFVSYMLNFFFRLLCNHQCHPLKYFSFAPKVLSRPCRNEVGDARQAVVDATIFRHSWLYQVLENDVADDAG